MKIDNRTKVTTVLMRNSVIYPIPVWQWNQPRCVTRYNCTILYIIVMKRQHCDLRLTTFLFWSLTNFFSDLIDSGSEEHLPSISRHSYFYFFLFLSLVLLLQQQHSIRSCYCGYCCLLFVWLCPEMVPATCLVEGSSQHLQQAGFER